MERIAGASAWLPRTGEDPVATLVQVVEAGRAADQEPWWDVYTRAQSRRQVEEQVAEIWNAPSTEDNTHPAPAERVRLLSRLRLPESPSHGDVVGNGHGNGNGAGAGAENGSNPPEGSGAAGGFLQDLFADPQALQAERTRQVSQMVAAYVAQNRLSNLSAIQQINAYLAEHPGLSNPLHQRAQVKLALRDFLGAEADGTELIALDGPNPAAAYYVRGLARAALGKNDDAIADFREALQRDQSLAGSARLELGDALMQAGQPERAVEEYTQALALSPDELHLFLRRGDALARAGRCAEADADFTRVLELDPGSAEALALRALERAQDGRHPEADADARSALAIDPLITNVIPALGRLCALNS
jgi:Flp pilus assembly protein TadD